MSAFVVPEATMNHVITAILATRTSHRPAFAGIITYTEDRSHDARRWPCYWDSSLIAQMDNGEATRAAAQEIAAMLWSMNIAAVCARYADDSPAAYAYTETYQFVESSPSRHQAFRSIECLLYQCYEGDVHETTLYHEVEALRDLLACEIVRDLPETRAALWSAA